MASRNVTVNVIGDSRSLERAFSRSTRASQTFGREVSGNLSRVDRGVTRLQRITAGGFVGGAAFVAVGAGLRSVLNAAAESQQVLGQTKVALEATGNSWERYGAQIESVVAKQSKLGFDDEALLRTFSLFVRQTNDVGQALTENSLAMDVARARFIDLEQAANLVNKAALGQAGSLRRLGIDTKGATTGTELLTLLTEKYGGSAQRAAGDATTAFDRMNVSIDNLKEAIGGNLLPTVSGLADTLSDTVDLLGQLGRVKVPPIHIPLIFDTEGSTLGNLAHKAVFTLPEFVNLTKDVVGNLIDDFRGETAAAEPEAAKGIGVVMSDFIDNVLISASAQVKPTVSFGDLLQNVLAGTINAGSLVGAIQQALGLAKTQVAQAIQAEKKGLADQKREAEAAKIQDQFAALIANLQLGVDRAGLTRRLDDDLRALNALKAGLERQVKAGVDVTDAQSQLVTVAQAIADKQDEIRQRAADAFQSRQFRALGLSATGDQVIPGVENLRKQLAQLTRRIGAEGVNLPSKLQSQLQGVRRVLSGEFGKATVESRDRINELFKTIRGTFDQESNKGISGPALRHVTLSDKILAALGFGKDPDVRRLGNLNTGGRTFGSASTATSQQPIHVHLHVGSQELGDVVIRDLQKRGSRSSAIASGRFAGRNLGLG